MSFLLGPETAPGGETRASGAALTAAGETPRLPGRQAG
jgi:hypothetical protein